MGSHADDESHRHHGCYWRDLYVSAERSAAGRELDGTVQPWDRKVRLRFINSSSMTTFDVRIPGLPLSVVAADGSGHRARDGR